MGKRALLRSPDLSPRARARKREKKPYLVMESPFTVEVGGKTYECKNVVPSPQGLLCVQHDNTLLVLPQPPLQQHHASF